MSVHLYEAAPKFTETGAGIAMFRRPWQVMKRLNLGEEIKTVANIPDPEDGLSMYSVLKFKGFPELMPLKIFRSRCQSLTNPRATSHLICSYRIRPQRQSIIEGKFIDVF